MGRVLFEITPVPAILKRLGSEFTHLARSLALKARDLIERPV
jgi:hypothetical protein